METQRTITMREHLIAQQKKLKDFFLSEWAREGYPADSRAALNAGLMIIQLLESENHELDQTLPDSYGLGRVGVAVFSAAGRPYSAS